MCNTAYMYVYHTNLIKMQKRSPDFHGSGKNRQNTCPAHVNVHFGANEILSPIIPLSRKWLPHNPSVLVTIEPQRCRKLRRASRTSVLSCLTAPYHIHRCIAFINSSPPSLGSDCVWQPIREIIKGNGRQQTVSLPY